MARVPGREGGIGEPRHERVPFSYDLFCVEIRQSVLVTVRLQVNDKVASTEKTAMVSDLDLVASLTNSGQTL